MPTQASRKTPKPKQLELSLLSLSLSLSLLLSHRHTIHRSSLSKKRELGSAKWQRERTTTVSLAFRGEKRRQFLTGGNSGCIVSPGRQKHQAAVFSHFSKRFFLLSRIPTRNVTVQCDVTNVLRDVEFLPPR